MYPAAPFNGARCARPAWTPNPDETGELPILSSQSDFKVGRWPRAWSTFATGPHFSDSQLVVLPSSRAYVALYGPRLVAATLTKVERQLLTLDMARAWVIGESRHAGDVGEECAGFACFTDEAIERTFRRGVPVVQF